MDAEVSDRHHDCNGEKTKIFPEITVEAESDLGADEAAVGSVPPHSEDWGTMISNGLQESSRTEFEGLDEGKKSKKR